MTPTTMSIFYDRKRILKRLYEGLSLIALGIGSVLYLKFSGFFSSSYIAKSESGSIFMLGVLSIAFSPILGGTLVSLRNILRLINKSPQLVLSEKGVFMNDYRAWGILPWAHITDIKRQFVESVASTTKEDSIVFHLSDSLVKKNFRQRSCTEGALLKSSSRRNI